MLRFSLSPLFERFYVMNGYLVLLLSEFNLGQCLEVTLNEHLVGACSFLGMLNLLHR